MANVVTAKCNDCQGPLVVRIGMKSTVRRVRCPQCGTGWGYSAWLLKVGQCPKGGRAHIFRVDFVKTVEVIQDVTEVR